MATVYNWVISGMQEYPTTPDGLDDVVFVVNWRRNATEIVGEKNYFVDTFGILYVAAPSPEDFTPYPDLTFDQVCGWLDAGLDVSAIDASLAIQIENLINPPTVSLPLPWVASPTTTTSTTTEEPVSTTTTTTTTEGPVTTTSTTTEEPISTTTTTTTDA